MAYTYTPATEADKAEAPPPEMRSPAAGKDRFALVDAVLRLLLFASAVVAVVVMVTSKETKEVALPFPPFIRLVRSAKFNHSPAFVYLVVAMSVAGLYSLITTLLSFFSLLKHGCPTKMIHHFVIFDVLLLGIVAAATGAAGAVAYIGFKGNSHSRWMKICNNFDGFCRHVGASVGASLLASIVLTMLILLSVYSLSKKIPRNYVHSH